jgi:hypothetical protein
LREEQRVGYLRRKMMKGIFRPRRGRNGRRETVMSKDIYSLLLLVVKVKSREMRWAGYITGIHAATSGINMIY